ARRVIERFFTNRSCAITEFSVQGLYQLIAIHMEPVDGYKKMINYEQVYLTLQIMHQ
uniref:Uncharacterized protein n=1 Tax=Anopheles albimanus TaxID=7167 RepID=A0A182FXH7_ANOAL